MASAFHLLLSVQCVTRDTNMLICLFLVLSLTSLYLVWDSHIQDGSPLPVKPRNTTIDTPEVYFHSDSKSNEVGIEYEQSQVVWFLF